ncbi:MAG: glutathione peroxidase [Polyangiaceae bacterium]|nr:glutathione peroxidase [Polyangiaceae bacterium]
MANVHQFPVKTIDGAEQTLEQYAGKTLLVVNVASKCGFTPQYRGLEEVYRRNKERGLVVLGFPCDQFGHQEPGDEAEIASFCTTQYDVTFPMFSKVNVNGKDAHPLFVHLKKEATGVLGSEAIKWNFTKFLVDKTGKVVKRFAPNDAPESIEEEIRPLL